MQDKASKSSPSPQLDGTQHDCLEQQSTAAEGAIATPSSLESVQGQAAETTSALTDGKVPVSLRVNGQLQTLNIEPRVVLLDSLREGLGLTGSKKGCDHGQCGACTVLIDGQRVYACLTLAVMQDGKDITTIEGLATGDQLHPVQSAFLDHDGFQCGYCTPGQICASVALLDEVSRGGGECRDARSDASTAVS